MSGQERNGRPVPTKPHVVCLSGSLSPGSRSERISNWCAAEIAGLGADTTVITGPELEFPFYRTHGQRPESVEKFLSALRTSDGIVVVSPTYHGTVSGLLKNAFDYINDLESDPQPFLDGRPVGCVAVSSGEQGATSTLATLRTIGHALRGWPTPLGVVVSGVVGNGDSDAAGIPVAERLVGQLRLMLGQVLSLAAVNLRRRRRLAERATVAS